jgi:hypothetical protein
MTMIFCSDRPGPAIHALVVGVGCYPYATSADPITTAGALAAGLKPLTTASLSATAVSDWLITNLEDDSALPLGSLHLLTSARGSPDPVNMGTFGQAFHHWYELCNRHQDNLALFYFCGHGVQFGQDYLALDDLGEDPHRLSHGLLNLSTLRRCVAESRARVRCFIVDACREMPVAFSTLDALSGWAPRDPRSSEWRQHMRDVGTIFSTASGRQADSMPNQVTPFTRALLEVLGGKGATRNRRTREWEIRLDNLLPSIRDVMDWNGYETEDGDIVLGAEAVSGHVFRTLAGPPPVSFEIGCDPIDALPYADLTLAAESDGTLKSRQAVSAVWRDEAPAGRYRLSASFAAGVYAPASSQIQLSPPWHCEDLAVELP